MKVQSHQVLVIVGAVQTIVASLRRDDAGSNPTVLVEAEWLN